MKHIDHISRSACLEIKIISSLRHPLTTKAIAHLMCSFVLSRLDNCKSLLIDINCDIQAAKSLKSCSEVVFRKSRLEHLDHRSRHFTGCQSDRIIFKISAFVFRFLMVPATIPVIVSLYIHSSHTPFQFR